MSWTFSLALLALLCIHAALAGQGAHAMPVEDKAESHDHWEHIVKRSAQNWDGYDYEDDTAHIVDVQAYYRGVFQEGWDDYMDTEEELFALLQRYEEAARQGRIMGSDKARVEQDAAKAMNLISNEKPIKGRYIVLFSPEATDYHLDRTIEILEQANVDSMQRIRIDHVAPLRQLRKGFTATMSSRTIEVVSQHLVYGDRTCLLAQQFVVVKGCCHSPITRP